MWNCEVSIDFFSRRSAPPATRAHLVGSEASTSRRRSGIFQSVTVSAEISLLDVHSCVGAGLKTSTPARTSGQTSAAQHKATRYEAEGTMTQLASQNLKRLPGPSHRWSAHHPAAGRDCSGDRPPPPLQTATGGQWPFGSQQDGQVCCLAALDAKTACPPDRAKLRLRT